MNIFNRCPPTLIHRAVFWVPLFGFQDNYCFLILPPEILFKPILTRWIVCSAAGRFFARDWLWHFLVRAQREIVSPHYSTWFSSNWLGFLCLGQSVATNCPSKIEKWENIAGKFVTMVTCHSWQANQFISGIQIFVWHETYIHSLENANKCEAAGQDWSK